MMLRRLGVGIFLGFLFSFCSEVSAYPLSLEQRYRFKQYLPNTFPKLEGRDPVHVVAIGGGNLYGASPNEKERKSGDSLRAFAGTFLEKLAVEFFYPGGVRLLNPPPGVPEKINQSFGNEIWLENLAVPGDGVLNGLQRVKSDAFLNDPDLILIQYGVQDALDHMSIHCFQRSLLHILEECKKRNVDVILLGPTPVNRGGGAMEWGITRPYTTAAKGIADSEGVLFIDTSRHMVSKFGGAADFQSEPLAGMELIGDRFKRVFHVPGAKRQTEYQHLNQKAHIFLGRSVFYELLDGPKPSDFSFAGSAVFGEGGMVRAVVSIRNQGADAKGGIIGALSVGGLSPVSAAQRYDVAPGRITELTFDYRRPVVGRSYEGTDIVYPLEIDDEVLRFPFVIEDGMKSEFVDLPLRVGPVSVAWRSKNYINISSRIKVEWDFVNGTQQNVSGIYRVGMGEQVNPPRSFSVAPLARRHFSEVFSFAPPGGADRYQSEVFIEVEVGGKSYRFTRELEASRDMALGEKMTMVSGRDYGLAPAGIVKPRTAGLPTVTFDAEDTRDGLYAIVDLNGIGVPDLGNTAAIRVLLTIDGRGKAVRSFGGVSPIVIYAKGGGGRGEARSIPLGAFGDGYDMVLPRSGITSVFRDSQLQIKVPRAYLNRHEWDFASGRGLFGVRLEISIVDPSNPRDPFPMERTYMTHYPNLVYGDEAVRGMTRRDARSLTTLRLSRQPVNSWSVRVY